MKNRKILPIIAFIPFLSGCWELENGEKIGEIIDLKKSGFLIKTWECKIIRGGLQDGSGIMGSSIQLTIEDKSLLDKVRKYMVDKKFVSIKYHQELITLWRSDSENYFMDSVQEVRGDRE